MKRWDSDIPAEAVEELVSEHRQEGNLIYWRTMNCVLDGQIVGLRQYDEEGQLAQETPLKDGLRHGREYTWWGGHLLSMEPYYEGRIHGVAEQYGREGKLIGVYEFVHGTGFDIWRSEAQDGRITVAEIHSMKGGAMHGYEWWVNADQSSVSHEQHWQQGVRHGIEREWNAQGRLRRGYPRYWIKGEAVTRRNYLRAAREDETLPRFREEDNSPRRIFPAAIQQAMPTT